MIKKILLIGCGNIGSRHLEGLLKSKFSLEITIIEKSKKQIEIVKKKISNHNFKNKKLIFFNKFVKKNFFFDLLICATTSEKRFDLIKNLVKKYKFSKIILEKIAFQNHKDFEKALRLLNKKNIDCWVNCPRREQKIYKEIKRKIKNNDLLTIRVSGNKWNLASNSIHFFDLFYFLTNDKNEFNKKTAFLKKISSKHINFYELTGLLKIENQKSKIILDDQKISKNIIVKIYTSNFKFTIYETQQFVKIVSSRNNIFKKAKLLKQSSLTTLLVDKIFDNKKIYLPSLKESFLSHKLLYFSFGEYFINRNKVLNCPIT